LCFGLDPDQRAHSKNVKAFEAGHIVWHVRRASVQKLLMIILIVMIATIIGILWVKPITGTGRQTALEKSATQ